MEFLALYFVKNMSGKMWSNVWGRKKENHSWEMLQNILLLFNEFCFCHFFK